ncbi:MAG: metal-dependent hydrolase [Salinigranum sp.]
MFVGHAMLAFALVTGVAAVRGWPRDRAVGYALLAGAFAAAPDVDIAYAPIGLALSGAGTPLAMAHRFWTAGNLVHRSITHSLVVAVPLAAAVALWVYSRRAARRSDPGTRYSGPETRRSGPGTRRSDAAEGRRAISRRKVAAGAALALVGGLVATATAVSGALGGAIMLLFGLVALGLAEAAVRRTEASAGTAFALALFGVASHPFGDLFAGHPPAFLYPLGITLVSHRIVLSPDPTLDLLSAFGIELLTIWLGFGAALWLAGARPTVPARASLAVGYAVSVVLLPAPTLDLSYPFVFSVLAVGALGPR